MMMMLAAALLTACGSEPQPSAGGTTPPAADAGTPKAAAKELSDDATAAEVAREARGKVKCPAKFQTARPAGTPVDDVVGVRPGMTWDEAVNVVLCTHDLLVVTPETRRGYTLQTYGQTLRQGFNARFAEPRVQKSSKQILAEMQDAAIARGSNRAVRDVQPGQAKWYVSTMGLPGEERVISAAREEWYETDRFPTMASVQEALQGKYGQPVIVEDVGGSGFYLIWAYDQSGQPSGRCRGKADPDLGVELSPDCGSSVSARIQPSRANPELAEYLQVATVDQAAGYDLLERTERALQAADAQRRAREVEEAAGKAAKPTL
ncbi:MAG: hypothetical protein WBO04_11295 [Steroidobacteraceae bacterium]